MRVVGYPPWYNPFEKSCIIQLCSGMLNALSSSLRRLPQCIPLPQERSPYKRALLRYASILCSRTSARLENPKRDFGTARRRKVKSSLRCCCESREKQLTTLPLPSEQHRTEIEGHRYIASPRLHFPEIKREKWGSWLHGTCVVALMQHRARYRVWTSRVPRIFG